LTSAEIQNRISAMFLLQALFELVLEVVGDSIWELACAGVLKVFRCLAEIVATWF